MSPRANRHTDPATGHRCIRQCRLKIVPLNHNSCRKSDRSPREQLAAGSPGFCSDANIASHRSRCETQSDCPETHIGSAAAEGISFLADGAGLSPWQTPILLLEDLLCLLLLSPAHASRRLPGWQFFQLARHVEPANPNCDTTTNMHSIYHNSKACSWSYYKRSCDRSPGRCATVSHISRPRRIKIKRCRCRCKRTSRAAPA